VFFNHFFAVIFYCPYLCGLILYFKRWCGVYLQLDCATSVASDFYFRSRLGQLVDVEIVNGNVTLPTVTATVSRVEVPSVSGELEQALSVDLTLIVLWQVIVQVLLSLSDGLRLSVLL